MKTFRGLAATLGLVMGLGTWSVAIAPGAGHNAHLESPTWFVDRVMQFMEANVGAPA